MEYKAWHKLQCTQCSRDINEGDTYYMEGSLILSKNKPFCSEDCMNAYKSGNSRKAKSEAAATGAAAGFGAGLGAAVGAGLGKGVGAVAEGVGVAVGGVGKGVGATVAGFGKGLGAVYGAILGEMAKFYKKIMKFFLWGLVAFLVIGIPIYTCQSAKMAKNYRNIGTV
mgnify:CR=1 FL=1